jgi:hypothetical protein
LKQAQIPAISPVYLITVAAYNKKAAITKMRPGQKIKTGLKVEGKKL